jgi:hypothetical protein
MTRRTALALIVAAALGQPLLAAAQAWPAARPIRRVP